MHWLLYGYMFLFIDRPFEVWPILGDLRVERIYMLMTLACAALAPGKRWPINVQHLAYACFAAAVLFCWAASPWAEKGQETVENYFKVLIFYVLLVSLVSDERALRRAVLAFLVVMTLYMLHSFREYLCGRHSYRMGIARMIGVDTSAGDPNTFGASIVFALPLVVPFWRENAARWVRPAILGYVGLSGLCVLLTGSRSSLLGLIVLAGWLIWRSPKRWLWLTAALVGGPLAFVALPGDHQARFETIINPSAGPENARVSGNSRIEGLFLGIELFQQYPLTGVGPGAWRPATRRPMESHNLVGQVLGEMGGVGTLAFIGIVACFWINLRRVRRLYRRFPEWGDDFLKHLCGAIGLGVFLMLFEGQFGHNLFRYNWLWYGGFLVVAVACLQRREQHNGFRTPISCRAEPIVEMMSWSGSVDTLRWRLDPRHEDLRPAWPRRSA